MYTFKKEPDPKNQFERVEIIHKADVVTSDELMEAFCYFMLANGFHKESMVSSLNYCLEVFDENEDE